MCNFLQLSADRMATESALGGVAVATFSARHNPKRLATRKVYNRADPESREGATIASHAASEAALENRIRAHRSLLKDDAWRAYTTTCQRLWMPGLHRVCGLHTNRNTSKPDTVQRVSLHGNRHAVSERQLHIKVFGLSCNIATDVAAVFSLLKQTMLAASLFSI